MKMLQKNKIDISEIITALKNGAVLVLPTDTVYGLVCDAANEKAVEKIFEIKKRDKSKPLAIFVKDIESAKDLAIVGEKGQKYLIDNKTTVILNAKEKKLSPLIYKNETIGIRIPNYNFLNLILKEFKNPLAQTSANISGNPAATKIKEVLKQFKDEDILIVDAGDLPKSEPSTIIDLTSNKTKILRK